MQTNTAENIAVALAAGQETTVPLNKLVLDTPYQSRKKKHTAEMIASYAATMRVVGLLHNLVVVDAGNGMYPVAAGEGRTRAYQLLASTGEVAVDHPVRVRIIPPEFAHLASLIENQDREAMHPADVFEGYAKLRDSGKSLEEIAAINGASVTAVRKLLALGDVAPELLDLFREGQATLEDMKALATVSDHERQRQAWAACANRSWNRAHQIGEILTDGECEGRSSVARYVTVAAYEKAGGEVRRTLFTETDDDVALVDGALVSILAIEKMKRSKLAKTLETEGWAWIGYQVSLDYQERDSYGHIRQVVRAQTPEDAAELAALEAAYKEAQTAWDDLPADADEEVEDAVRQAYDQAEKAVFTLRERMTAYIHEQKAFAGCIVHLDYSGSLTVTRGLVRREDRAALVEHVQQSTDPDAKQGVDIPKAVTRPVHSDALVGRMRAQLTVAAQAELAVRPQLSLCMFTAQLAVKLIKEERGYSATPMPFDIAAYAAGSNLANTDERVKASAAWQQIDAALAQWKERMPTTFDALVDWLLTLSMDEVVQLQGLLLSLTVASATHAETFAQRIELDMTRWWTPTADSYFGHVSKARMSEVIGTTCDEETAKSILEMKKGAAAIAAEQAIAGKNWLPDVLQTGARVGDLSAS